MKFNNLYKNFLNLLLLSPLAFANDCDKIKEYLTNNNLVEKIVNECIVNEEGNVTTLKLKNVDLSLTQNDINQLTSYNTINILEYEFSQAYKDIANVTSEFKNDSETYLREIEYEDSIKVSRT